MLQVISGPETSVQEEMPVEAVHVFIDGHGECPEPFVTRRKGQRGQLPQASAGPWAQVPGFGAGRRGPTTVRVRHLQGRERVLRPRGCCTHRARGLQWAFHPWDRGSVDASAGNPFLSSERPAPPRFDTVTACNPLSTYVINDISPLTVTNFRKAVAST